MQFASLTEEEQVARLSRLAVRALDAWGLADARVELIKYRENAVFSVTAEDDSRTVLRVHRAAYRTDEHIRSEVAWMRALSEHGIPTPTVLPTKAGDIIIVVQVDGVPESRQCDLIAWVDGQPLGTLEGGVALDDAALQRTYETIGEIAARLHEHGLSWQKPPAFARPAWDVESLVGEDPAWGRFWELDVLAQEQKAVLLQARDRVRERLRALGPATLLIHGDLIPDNVLVGPDGERVIDFDDCGWSWCAFELVTSVFPLLISGGFENGLSAYLAGYRRVRPFPEKEMPLVPTLIMARALSYLGWPVGRPEIHSQRQLASLIAAAVTDLAERYLSDALRERQTTRKRCRSTL